MGNTTVTLRPNATTDDAGWTIGGGSGSVHAALSDNSDSTYVTATTATSGTNLVVEMGTATIPALAVIKLVTPRLRASQATGAETLLLQVQSPGFTDAVTPSASITTISGTARSASASGAGWTQADINALRIVLLSNGAGNQDDVRVYEAYVDVTYNQAPTVTPTAPSGSVTDTTQPTVAWTYGDPEGDPQERYRIRVFPSSVYTAGGFDPAVSSGAAWDSFDVISSATSAVIGSALRNGISYRAYVKVADAGSAGRFGAWAFTSFSVTIDPPAVPDVTAVADPANARVTLTANGHDNNLTANQADITTGTTGWVTETNCTLSTTLVSLTAAHGPGFLILTATANGTISAKTLAGTSGVRVFGGTDYTALLALRADTHARSSKLFLNWYDSGGSLLSQPVSAPATNSTGGWTTYTVHATAPLNAAFAAAQPQVLGCLAGERHFVDTILIAPGTLAAWTRGGFVPTQRIVVERSADGGTTWLPVRLSSTSPVNEADLTDPGQFGTFHDYECPPAVPVLYRARTTATDGGAVFDSDYSSPTPPVTLTAVAAWLKDPLDPTLNRTVCLVSPPLVSTSSEPQQAFSGLGDPYWSVSSDVAKGEVGELVLAFDDDGGFAAFEALRGPSRTLLLQTGYGDGGSEQIYVRLGADRTVTRLPAKPDGLQARIVTVGYRQVQEPA